MEKQLEWTPASLGCHWFSGPYTISTWQQGEHSGYQATYRFLVIGRYQTLTGAQRGVQIWHNSH